MKKILILSLFVVILTTLSFKLYNTSTNQPLTKYVYLTFDDGPLNGSQHVNDAVIKEAVPITVMLVGAHAEVRPTDVRLYRENPYIEMGNHSYSHANDHYQLYYSDPEGVLADFIKNRDSLRLENNIGRLPGRNMWRINGRSRNDISSGIEAADLLHRNGYSLFGWDLEWRHDSHTAEPIGTAEDIFNQMQQLLSKDRLFTPNHIVLLCHDEMFRNTYDESELKKLIELLKGRPNYKLVQLKDYP
jgi:peptidoglycan/xylan/chitin deacetylase (PgdA/CDA1 family)